MAAPAKTAIDKLKGRDTNWKWHLKEKTDLIDLLYGGATSPREGTPSEIALGFVLANSEGFIGKSASDDDAISFEVIYERKCRKGNTVRLAQMYSGIPIYGADVAVLVFEEKRVIHAANRALPVAHLSDVHMGKRPYKEILPIIRDHVSALGGPVVQENSDDIELLVWKGNPPLLGYRTAFHIGVERRPWEIVAHAENGTLLHKAPLFSKPHKKENNKKKKPVHSGTTEGE